MKIEENNIYLWDSFELINNLEDGSIDQLITDPPYNISRKTNFHTMHSHRWTSMDFWEWDKWFDLTGWIELVIPKLKKWANIVIFNDWKNLGDISKKLEELGCETKRILQYKKTNPAPFNRDRLFLNTCEYALWATKTKWKIKNNNNWKWVFNRRVEEWHKFETGIFEYPVQRKAWHTTPKPIWLMKDIIKVLSNPGDIILDPFAWSWTTWIGAKELWRKYIMFEKDEESFEYAKNRLLN